MVFVAADPGGILRREFPYDLIHGHNTWLAPNRYASRANRLHGTGLFYHTHGSLDPIVINNGVLCRMRKSTSSSWSSGGI